MKHESVLGVFFESVGANIRLGSSAPPIWVDFRYEKLPYFCFTCGRIGHLLKECLEEGSQNLISLNCFPYGIWMKASNSIGTSKSIQNFYSHRRSTKNGQTANPSKVPWRTEIQTIPKTVPEPSFSQQDLVKASTSRREPSTYTPLTTESPDIISAQAHTATTSLLFVA
ncbi:Zinc knuckle CX2CX4HX4C [Trema orientale]|uniref:Zinc knuckle CX2CX4HX4C n=1 Tax=Trema orientale TaxID=63057 RepID=A0A2P5DBM1_TREOI|nr:Zinc knuckle CX2CX4HX4C [Trema orientale]